MEQKFRQLMNRAVNFFKHADNDADEILDSVQEEINDFFLRMAIDDYRGLGFQPTAEMEAFDKFFFILYRARMPHDFRDLARRAWSRRAVGQHGRFPSQPPAHFP